MSAAGAEAIAAGRTAVGIEFGSTRIKACLIDADDPATVLAVGGHDWENRFEDRTWTYALDDVWTGLQSAFATLVADAEQRHGVRPDTFGAIGVSAMMHGYLAFDESGDLLVPFRTWRNTTTGRAAAELSTLFGVNMPLRWSIAHLHQAVLDDEPHVPRIRSITTLAGYVHERLTGRGVLGVGDASGMFPIDPATRDYDERMLHAYDELVSGGALARPVRALLPEVLVAGESAGALTAEGALMLDPTGGLRPGIPFCPPEGDAGTGMVATDAVAPRTGNVSAGTSIFAMVVLEHPLAAAHDELDIVTTPAGDLVAMVHCNNGASELATWAAMFGRFAAASGAPIDQDAVFEILLGEALSSPADAGGVVVYNHLAGEPIAGLDEGRPMVVRSPDSVLTLGSFMRAQVYGVFGTLSIGMRVLSAEDVTVERMFAHGGVFRTAGVAQRFLAAALDAPVAVGETRTGVARKTVVGHVSNPAVLAHVEDWQRAAAGWAASRTLKLARFGDNMRYVAVTEGDKTEAELRFGVQVNTWGVNELAARVDQSADSEIDALVGEYLDLYDVQTELRPGGDRHRSLRDGAAIELGLRSFLEEGGFGAFTTTFEDLGSLTQLPGLAVQRLMAEGYGFGAEGDWKTAILVRIANVMGAGLPGGASLMEDYTYDLVPGDEKILGAHMLEVAPSLTTHRPRLEVHPLGIGGKDDPVRLVFTADPGPALVVAMSDMRDRFRLVANVVDNVEAPDLPKLPVGRAVWKPQPDFATSAACWLAAGAAHHTVMTTAVGIEVFRDFAEIAGVELLTIDDATTVRAFQRELRWNAAYYRLAQGL